MHHRSATGIGLRRVVAIGLAGALIGGCSSGIGSEGPRNMLGDPLVSLGLKADPNRPYIEYGPRSPLVMPSSGELPAPQQGEQVAANVAMWPDDPDERTRREYEAARRAAAEESVKDVENASRTMSRADLDDWGRRFGRNTAARPARGEIRSREQSKTESPTVLRQGRADPNAPPEVRERRTLVEPPDEYRTPAPVAEAEQAEAAERPGWFRRSFGM